MCRRLRIGSKALLFLNLFSPDISPSLRCMISMKLLIATQHRRTHQWTSASQVDSLLNAPTTILSRPNVDCSGLHMGPDPQVVLLTHESIVQVTGCHSPSAAAELSAKITGCESPGEEAEPSAKIIGCESPGAQAEPSAVVSDTRFSAGYFGVLRDHSLDEVTS